MSKRAIIVVLALVAVAAVLIVHGAVNVVCEVGQVRWQAGSFAVRPHVNPLRCKAIAIVTPSARQGMGGLQQSVARELQRGLGRAAPALRVVVYPDMASAKRAKPDYFIGVTPREWRWSAWPLSRRWAASVLVEGSTSGKPVEVVSTPTALKPSAYVMGEHLPPGVDSALLRESLFEGRRDYRDLHVVVVVQGKSRGIFSTSDLTSRVAKSVADKVIREIQRDGVDPPDPFKATR